MATTSTARKLTAGLDVKASHQQLAIEEGRHVHRARHRHQRQDLVHRRHVRVDGDPFAAGLACDAPKTFLMLGIAQPCRHPRHLENHRAHKRHHHVRLVGVGGREE